MSLLDYQANYYEKRFDILYYLKYEDSIPNLLSNELYQGKLNLELLINLMVNIFKKISTKDGKDYF